MNRCQKGSEGKPPPTAEGGREPPLEEEEEVGGGRRGEGATTTRGEGGRRGSEPPSYGELEGIRLMSFHFILKKRTTAPLKEGRGRKHHQKKEETAAIGGKDHRPKGGGEGEIHLSFWWCSLPSPPSGGGDFPRGAIPSKKLETFSPLPKKKRVEIS